MSENYVGYFRGRKTIQRSATIGGARSVFVKLQGNKNELVYPTFGGQIKNPFKGAAKMFAGDLMEYRTDANGLNPEIYLLKTYLVHSGGGNVINFLNDGYKHTPFVGDTLGVALSESELAFYCTIEKVEVKTIDGVKVWSCTIDKTYESDINGAGVGSVFEEVYFEAVGAMDYVPRVSTVNAVAPTDMDMLDASATGDEDFDGARYFYTPALGGIMYTNKMSPIPRRFGSLNQSKVNGWFQIQSV